MSGNAHRNQHTEMADFHARRFYQHGAKGFSAFDVTTAAWASTHARKAGVKRGYFDVDLPGVDRRSFEKWMSTIESAAAQAVARLDTRRTIEGDWAALARYAALLRGRVPAVDAGMTALATAEPFKDRIRYRLDSEGAQGGLQSRARVLTQLNIFATWVPYLTQAARVRISDALVGDLLVADNPALFVGDKNGDRLAIALGRSLLLEFFWSPGPSKRVSLSAEAIARWNRISVLAAHARVYAPSPAVLVEAADGSLVHLAAGFSIDEFRRGFAQLCEPPRRAA